MECLVVFENVLKVDNSMTNCVLCVFSRFLPNRTLRIQENTKFQSKNCPFCTDWLLLFSMSPSLTPPEDTPQTTPGTPLPTPHNQAAPSAPPSPRWATHTQAEVGNIYKNRPRQLHGESQKIFIL
ncbi:hypothetical protein NQD34_009965 [Periophthalmus magnuspinnatus]|nr:hypothetical protein NQD34_009965 [Periophthalmus magnuspinnatus]